jgi:molecular chaperone IbpA
MTKFTSLDLTPFYRNSIGVDRLFDRLIDQMDHASGTNYPPYNIIKTGENSFEVQIAVAGFGEGEIDITVNDGNLVVTGNKDSEVETDTTAYLYRGISARRFVRSFSLADYVEVVNAVSRNGILSITLERKIPEELKPKTIAITYSN